MTWHEHLIEEQLTIKQEDAVYMSMMQGISHHPKRMASQKVILLLLNTLIPSQKYQDQQCYLFTRKSVNFTIYCCHSPLISFILFKNEDLVYQEANGYKLTNTQAKFTKALRQIAKISSSGIQKHPLHTSTSKCRQHAILIIQQKKQSNFILLWQFTCLGSQYS